MSAKKRFIFIALATVVLVTVSVFAASCSSKKTVSEYKIGVVLSTSGPNAPLGQSEQRSITLLENQINAQGGIDGSKVRFIVEDDQSDPAKSNVAITKLITQEGAIAATGSSGTGTTLAMAPIIDKDMIPLVSMAAGVQVTQPVQKWIFSVAPSDALVTQRILMYLRGTLKIKRFAVLHDANAYGTGGADQLKKTAASYGLQIVANESYGSADTDMTAQLTKIKGTDAQALVVWGTNPGPASVAKNMSDLNMTIPFVGSSGIANKKFIELAGPAANGVVFAASRLIIPSSIPAGSAWSKSVNAFAAAYKKAYGLDIDTFAAHGWDSSNIMVNAIKSAGADSAAIQAAIQNLKNYAGVDGVFTYSATDHAGLKVSALMMVKIENGQWVEVKP
jgi:branched-chain amino acid transport system substrate-binding protein